MYQQPTTRLEDLKKYFSAKQDLALNSKASGPDEFYGLLGRVQRECNVNLDDEYLFDNIGEIAQFLTDNGFEVSGWIEHEREHGVAAQRLGYVPQYGCFFFTSAEGVGYAPFTRTKGHHSLKEIAVLQSAPRKKSSFDRAMLKKIDRLD